MLDIFYYNNSNNNEMPAFLETESQIIYDDSKAVTRAEDGSLILRNPNILEMSEDYLYHFSLGTSTHDLRAMFSDIKFVVMGGTPKRMEAFADFMLNELKISLPPGTGLIDISKYSYRYSMYKVGPVLSVSHGMGIPSVSIMLHEIIKLMYYAECKDVQFFRMGTCGGIGVEGGNLIITEAAVDGLLRPYLEVPVLGQLIRRPAILDLNLAKDLKNCNEPEDTFEIYLGKTMCTYDFYEGQGRLDGAFCNFTMKDKLEFLQKISEAGIINMEMESLAFAAMCNYAGIKGAVVCVALLNRLNGDQITASKSQMEEWQHRPQQLLSRYIKKQLEIV